MNCHICQLQIDCSCHGVDVFSPKTLKYLPCFRNRSIDYEPRSRLYNLEYIHLCSEECETKLSSYTIQQMTESGLKEVKLGKYSSWYDPLKKSEAKAMKDLKRKYSINT